MKWARESAKLDIATAAKKIERSEEDIRQWESGAARPTLAQARKAAEVYRRSLAVFYLPEPPRDFATLRDFRQLSPGESREWSPELALLIRQVQYKQQWLREFLVEEGEEPVSLMGEASLDTSSSDLAIAIRQILEVDIQEQIACSDPREALNLWVDHVELAGISICRQGGIESEECRGFCLTDEYAPFIYLNSNDSYAGRLFTLVHELAHLLINQPGISNMAGSLRRLGNEEARIERFCNRVAAAALVEGSLLEVLWSQRDPSEGLPDQVHSIAHHFSVSEEVIARCLLDRQDIEEREYLRLRQYYVARWVEYRRKQAAMTGGPPYGLRMALANGNHFAGIVLSAYKRGRISGRDASSLLNVKVNNLRQVESHVFSVKTRLRGGRQ